MHAKYHEKYGYDYEITSDNNKELMGFLRAECRKYDIVCDVDKLFAYFHEFPENKGYEQLSLF